MKITVILGHPGKESFNHAIATAAVEQLITAGHSVTFHDLYTEKFDPILPLDEIPKHGKVDPKIQQYCTEIVDADGLVVVHPNWWGQPPAIVKGWIDRVLRAGVAYEFVEGDNGAGLPKGLLKLRAAVIFNTSNTPGEREHTVFCDPLQLTWKNCITDLCGAKTFYRTTFSPIVDSTLEQRKKWLIEVRNVVDKQFK
ncbi:MAG: NAD(P)H-dependent oxidoreductase [Elusimicrobiota bacterium]